MTASNLDSPQALDKSTLPPRFKAAREYSPALESLGYVTSPPYKSANCSAFEQTYLFVHKLVWAAKGQQIGLICKCFAYECVWEAGRRWQHNLPVLNYVAKNAKPKLSQENSCRRVSFNAASVERRCLDKRFAERTAVFAVFGWRDFIKQHQSEQPKEGPQKSKQWNLCTNKQSPCTSIESGTGFQLLFIIICMKDRGDGEYQAVLYNIYAFFSGLKCIETRLSGLQPDVDFPLPSSCTRNHLDMLLHQLISHFTWYVVM